MQARPELVREAVRDRLEGVHISIADKIREGVTTFREAGATEAYFGNPGQASAEEGEMSYEALADMLVTATLEMLAELEG